MAERSARRSGIVDVRLRGFGDRASFDEATAWVARHAHALSSEEIDAADCRGRALAAPLDAPVDVPQFHRASVDGYAVRAAETVGAGPYNPLSFALREGAAGAGRCGAVLVVAGAPLPPGSDAVLPFDVALANGSTVEVVGSIAEGEGVEPEGLQLEAGAALLPMGRVLRAEDVGLLASLGVDRVSVVRRPRVRVLEAGPRSAPGTPGTARDANGPMLRGLVSRDGGIVVDEPGDARSSGIGEAIARAGADVVLVAGRTGTGPDDDAPLVLAEVGDLHIHGVAVRPGGSLGLGLSGSVPVVLLPGDPLACLCAYELFAGGVVRRLGGRPPGLPHAVREAEVGRKIVSAIGSTDVCRVRFAGGRIEPTGAAESGGLASAVRADGFVVVPAPLEGYPPGARVAVYLY